METEALAPLGQFIVPSGPNWVWFPGVGKPQLLGEIQPFVVHILCKLRMFF